MASPFRSIILVALASVLGLGFYDFLTNFENNQCEMTYMYQLPEYLEVPLGDELKGSYPRYKLYLYGEGEYAAKSSNFKLSGIPVLFIPGNAGSYKQVRSLASVAIKKAEKKNFHFNYFALDFNEELGALFGGYVDSQTEFASACIEQILLLYKDASHPPNSVVLVGHSMGGMVARALFTLPNFDKSRVHTVITQATPHQLPVVALDLNLAAFYDRVNSFWRQEHNLSLSHVTVLSTGGGFRDTHVRNDLSNMIGLHDVEKQVSTSTMSLPGGWVSTDHLCHVWCKQLVLSTKRALFDMVDPKSKQIAVNTLFRIRTFYHHFIHNPGSNKVKFTFDAKVALDENVQWEVRKKPYWRMNRKSLEKKRYSVLTMPFFDKEQFASVAISNIPNVAWIGTCQLQVKQTACTEMENISPGANLLPPQAANRKVVHLSVEELRTSTHIVTVLPQSTSKVEVAAELYNITERHLDYNITGILDFFRNFPSSVMAEGVLIERTAPNAIFYNITLNGLEIPLQAHTVHVECVKCSDAATAANAGTVAKMHVPWGSGNTFKFIPIGKNGSIDVKLLSGMPANFPYKAQLHLYLAPTCVYRVTIDTAFKQLYGQFVRFYAPLLPAFFVIQILMVLAWQLKSLDETGIAPSFGEAHVRWAQPWRVVPVAMLLKFLLTYPEEDNIAKKIGLPVDDTTVLTQMNTWYAALPVMLYLSSYSVMGLYGPLVETVIGIKSFVFGALFRCALRSPSLMRLLRLCRLSLFILGVYLSLKVCGTLGIIITYIIFAFETGASYVDGRSQKQESKAFNRFYVFNSLLLLLLATLVLNAAPFLVWIKDYSVSPSLDFDPSRAIGVTVCVFGFLVTRAKFPVEGNEWYSVCGTLCYLSCVSMVTYTLLSVYRITYFIQADLIILATVVTIVSMATPSVPVKVKKN